MMRHRLLIVLTVIMMMGGRASSFQPNEQLRDTESSSVSEAAQDWEKENSNFLMGLKIERSAKLKRRADLVLSYFSNAEIYVLNGEQYGIPREKSFQKEMLFDTVLPELLERTPIKRDLVVVSMGLHILVETGWEQSETFLRLVEQLETFFKQQGFSWIVFKITTC